MKLLEHGVDVKLLTVHFLTMFGVLSIKGKACICLEQLFWLNIYENVL